MTPPNLWTHKPQQLGRSDQVVNQLCLPPLVVGVSRFGETNVAVESALANGGCDLVHFGIMNSQECTLSFSGTQLLLVTP